MFCSVLSSADKVGHVASSQMDTRYIKVSVLCHAAEWGRFPHQLTDAILSVPKTELSAIRGHLCAMPLEFLVAEDLMKETAEVNVSLISSGHSDCSIVIQRLRCSPFGHTQLLTLAIYL